MSGTDAAAQAATSALTLARLLLAGVPAAAILARAQSGEWGPAVAASAAGDAATLFRMEAVLQQGGFNHAAPMTPAALAAHFDRLVCLSPEASVAFYTLGAGAALDAATDEIVAWLAAQALITPACHVLDIGCGIGRVAAALRPRCAFVVGTDISAGMLAEARRRDPLLPMVRIDGGSFACLRGHEFDLVLAVDSFPYIYLSGAGAAHVREAARVLRPGGALAVLNLSYRDDADADQRDFSAWCAAAGLRADVTGGQPFRLWDGRAYLARRVAPR